MATQGGQSGGLGGSASLRRGQEEQDVPQRGALTQSLPKSGAQHNGEPQDANGFRAMARKEKKGTGCLEQNNHTQIPPGSYINK